MEYLDSVERSTELLRKALPLMSRQAAALHPVSYAVWYAYVADVNSPLHKALDTHLAEGHSFDDIATELAALLAMLLLVSILAISRYRVTLD